MTDPFLILSEVIRDLRNMTVAEIFDPDERIHVNNRCAGRLRAAEQGFRELQHLPQPRQARTGYTGPEKRRTMRCKGRTVVVVENGRVG